MVKYTVKLYPLAKKDIEDIFSYIALTKESPENAKNCTDRIKEKILGLECLPESHQERNVGRFAYQGYRQLIVDNYIVIYKIDKKKHIVYVVRIQYHKRKL